ncbi:MAG: hypothetical protein OEY07_19010 [Gammaproteobacteria bacterium]|nr:hypothetical protein [Gammaproteobacteria bacterium]
MRLFNFICAVLTVGIISNPVLSEQDMTPEQLEAWFNDDKSIHPYDRKSDGGVLVFLAKPPTKRTPHSSNILTVNSDSLRTGWVEVEQCHAGLDPVPAVEVVYRYKEMRHLQVVKSSGIGKVWVDGQTVQLEEVKKGASLCIRTEARIMVQLEGGRYVLFNGPFQRRFLDSYFPMHVTLVLRYPRDELELTEVLPRKTDGFKVESRDGEINLDAWFEGKLLIRAEFKYKS